MPTIYIANDPINHNLQRKRSLKGITRLQIGIYDVPGFLFRSQTTKYFSIDFHYSVSAWEKSPNIDRPNLHIFSVRSNFDSWENVQKTGGWPIGNCSVGRLKVDTLKFHEKCSEERNKSIISCSLADIRYQSRFINIWKYFSIQISRCYIDT